VVKIKNSSRRGREERGVKTDEIVLS